MERKIIGDHGIVELGRRAQSALRRLSPASQAIRLGRGLTIAGEDEDEQALVRVIADI